MAAKYTPKTEEGFSGDMETLDERHCHPVVILYFHSFCLVVTRLVIILAVMSTSGPELAKERRRWCEP